MRLGPLVTSLLGSFGGRALGQAIGGRTGSMIGSLAGSVIGGSLGSGRGGGLGSILGGVLGGANKGGQEQVDGRRLADAQPLPDLDDDHALVLIKAMCSAAKSDGHVDEQEIAAITRRLGDLDAEEEALLRRELSGPVDLRALVAAVPAGFESEVYGVSLLAIDQVSGAEAEYLSDLAVALGLNGDQTAAIRHAVGADS